jgi:hypothetical protein
MRKVASRGFALTLALSVHFFPSFVQAHSVTPVPGGIKIVCDNGRVAIAKLQGSIIMVEITELDGRKSGMSLMPSGGSTDPAVAIGNGRSIAREVCG